MEIKTEKSWELEDKQGYLLIYLASGTPRLVGTGGGKSEKESTSSLRITGRRTHFFVDSFESLRAHMESEPFVTREKHECKKEREKKKMTTQILGKVQIWTKNKCSTSFFFISRAVGEGKKSE